MTRELWRVDKLKYAAAAKTGEGARLIGGRWTSRGQPAIYCAEHLSLAILEVLVQTPHPSQRTVARVRIRIRVDRRLIEHADGTNIPADLSPRTPYDITQPIGDEWLSQVRSPVLSVPSVVVPTESNYLLNPRHPKFGELSWDNHEAITLDERLWAVGR